MKTYIALHYLPCVQWFSKLASGAALIEQYEHYTKGSYRNRCHIIGANGVLPLSIPLLKGKNSQMPIQDVRISYTNNWQKLHWQSIISAYGNAPFFEFYADELKVHFEERTPFLFDFNLRLLEKLCDLMGLDNNLIVFTERYEKEPDGFDLRTGISPKPKYQVNDPYFEVINYGQVFLEKHGFVENMSVLDLLFCCGPGGFIFGS